MNGKMALCLVVLLAGCRQYPAATSRESLTLMKLLYSACNTRDSVRLEQVERSLEQLASEGKLGQAEQEAFGRIVGLARSGEWKKAEDAAFRFSQDQVGRGTR